MELSQKTGDFSPAKHADLTIPGKRREESTLDLMQNCWGPKPTRNFTQIIRTKEYYLSDWLAYRDL